MNRINVAIVGLGYWGPNLVRNFAGLDRVNLQAVCDVRTASLVPVGKQYPAVQLVADYAQVLQDGSIEAIVIATPVETHYELAKAALQAGKHVMVEKPLATTTAQCLELIDLAEKYNKVLMVGHVFLYNVAVKKLKSYIDRGELGQIYYIYSSRLNLGRIRRDVNARWNFAPHDISIILHLLEMMPSQVNARGFSYIQEGIEDVVFVTLNFPSGTGVNIHISWLDPRKVRLMTVVGSKKMVIYDDASSDAKIQVYDKGVTTASAQQTLGDFSSFGEFQLLLRAGDVLIPKIDFVEPLKVECQHFVECIIAGKRPITDGQDGLQVVQVLEAAQRSLLNEGRPEVISDESTLA
jgi:predicted dehydrogenase